MDSSPDMIRALRPVVAELDRLEVRYCVGGSIASSFHGAGRSTLDVDLAAELTEAAAVTLVKSLRAEYYGSESAAREAVRDRSCFNLIHLPTAFKVDIFVCKQRDFDRSVLDRAISDSLGTTDSAEPLSARIASPEDIILIKLEWYRLGDETSQRQWSDVTRVAKVFGNRLNRTYIKHWAGELGVLDLIERLFLEIESKQS